MRVRLQCPRLPRWVARARSKPWRELVRSGTRLITFSGAGGIGKSRLALEVARRLAAEFGPDLYYVSVEAVTSPELLSRAIADRLQLRLEGTRSPLDALVEYLRARRSLLLLDNFEQVVDAAGQVAALIERCPRLQVLVTSRQVLRLQVEREYPVPPLDVPIEHASAEQVLAQVTSGVQLFVERAQATRPGFRLTSANAAVIAELCRRLDGLPLAIELAAGRIRLLSPDALLERIERRLDLIAGGGPDLPARQRTLRATLDWSYQLLGPFEQALFARLSVFAGGATVEAIEAVCSDDEGPDLLDGLSSLLEKSLLTSGVVEAVGQPRLQMLQIVRDYALRTSRGARRDGTVRRPSPELVPPRFRAGQRAAPSRCVHVLAGHRARHGQPPGRRALGAGSPRRARAGGAGMEPVAVVLAIGAAAGGPRLARRGGCNRSAPTRTPPMPPVSGYGRGRRASRPETSMAPSRWSSAPHPPSTSWATRWTRPLPDHARWRADRLRGGTTKSTMSSTGH